MTPVELVLGGLVLIVLVAALSKRTGVASPLLLLVVGIGAGYLPFVHVGEIPSDWILDYVLPPLLYATALGLPVTDFRRNLRSIAGLAVVLVLVTTVVAGLVLNWAIADVTLFGAIALGAVVSPTDAVAATSIARRLGLPERTVSVLEGESLLNDATALTLLAAAVTASSTGSLTVGLVALQFFYSVLVATAVGAVVGVVSVAVGARLRDPVLTTAVSFVVPFAAFFPAEGLHASGVLATVVAGLVTGVGGRRRFDGTQRVTNATNWRTVQFLLEEGVFLAMGLQLHSLVDDLGETPRALLAPIGTGMLLVVVLVVVRTGYVFADTALLRRAERRTIARADAAPAPEPPEGHGVRAARRRRRHAVRLGDLEFLRANGATWAGALVVGWSGMRGVVTLAGAQSLPDDPAHPGLRPMLVLIAFVVAVVSLIGFGGSLPAVIRVSGAQGADSAARRSELVALTRRIYAAGVRALDDPGQTLVDGVPADRDLVERVRTRYTRPPVPPGAERTDEAAMTAREQAFVLRRRVRDAARDELLDASATGAYSSSTIAAARRMLDIEDAREDTATAL